MLQDEITALNIDFGKAVSNRDLDAVLEFYASDARMLAPNAPMAEGRPAIRATLQGFLDAGLTSLDLHSLDVVASGDLVIDVGRYVLGVQPPGSEPLQDRGKYAVVLRRDADGSLKIIVDAFNSDEPVS